MKYLLFVTIVQWAHFSINTYFILISLALLVLYSLTGCSLEEVRMISGIILVQERPWNKNVISDYVHLGELQL